MRRIAIAVLTIVTSLSLAGWSSPGQQDARAGDWPQWRGPSRDGISAETRLLQAWPEPGPPLAWSVNTLGTGYGTVAVAGERLFLVDNDGLDVESVVALSFGDGRRLWKVPIGRVGKPQQSPSYPSARSTPTIDGEFVYALGSDGDLVSLHAATGAVRWSVNLRRGFSGEPGPWAYAESPLVDGDLVVVTPGGSSSTMVALDKRTGALVWKSSVPDVGPAGYASIVIARIGVRRIYVQVLSGGLIGVDATTGTLLWRSEHVSRARANIPTAVVVEDYLYSALAPVGGAVLRMTPSASGVDATTVHVTRGLPTAIGGSVAVRGSLFGTTEDGLVAADLLSGKLHWTAASVGPASVLYAAGRLYLHGEDGEVALVEADATAYRERGRFMPQQAPARTGDRAWAYPVVARGHLFIRDKSHLWAYDIRVRR